MILGLWSRNVRTLFFFFFEVLNTALLIFVLRSTLGLNILQFTNGVRFCISLVVGYPYSLVWGIRSHISDNVCIGVTCYSMDTNGYNNRRAYKVENFTL